MGYQNTKIARCICVHHTYTHALAHAHAHTQSERNASNLLVCKYAAGILLALAQLQSPFVTYFCGWHQVNLMKLLRLPLCCHWQQSKVCGTDESTADGRRSTRRRRHHLWHFVCSGVVLQAHLRPYPRHTRWTRPTLQKAPAPKSGSVAQAMRHEIWVARHVKQILWSVVSNKKPRSQIFEQPASGPKHSVIFSLWQLASATAVVVAAHVDLIIKANCENIHNTTKAARPTHTNQPTLQHMRAFFKIDLLPRLAGLFELHLTHAEAMRKSFKTTWKGNSTLIDFPHTSMNIQVSRHAHYNSS